MTKSVVIESGKDDLNHWKCSISENDHEIIYLHHILPINSGMEYEDTLKMIKKENPNISFDDCVNFLKTIDIKGHDSMQLFMRYLDNQGIKYKHTFWDRYEKD